MAMVDLVGLHKYFIMEHLNEGDTAVDFTMGNGHDTEFLSKTVVIAVNVEMNGKPPFQIVLWEEDA